MPVLNLLVPTKRRSFTFYDRAAILLDPDEMSAQRVRISVSIFATPVSRSLNLKYPYSKEFYGYAQGFFTGELTNEFPINYSVQYIWDYWNEHATLSHQLADVFQKLELFLRVSGLIQIALVTPVSVSLAANMLQALNIIRNLTNCITIDTQSLTDEVEEGSRFLNTFVHPFDLIRFKFPFGTVFTVNIDSWNLENTADGTTPPPWPEELPYNPANPNDSPPESTPGLKDPENPYGAVPPDSSPRDPRLDPNEFSNAPDPTPPPIGECLRSVGDVQISGLDNAPRAIDFVTGPYPSGFTVSWEQAGVGINPPFPPFFNVRVRAPDGSLVDEPITVDLLGSASLQRVVCPPVT